MRFLNLSAVSTLWNEWALLHVFYLYKNECGGFHVRTAGGFLPEYCYFVQVQYWELGGRLISRLVSRAVLLGSFCFHRFVPEWMVHFCVVKSRARSAATKKKSILPVRRDTLSSESMLQNVFRVRFRLTEVNSILYWDVDVRFQDN